MEAAAAGPIRVLVVDDQDQVAEITCVHLENMGCVTESFGRAEAALDRIRAGGDPFDLVITDLAMPGMTGTELVLALREIAPSIPVIVMTGYSSEAEEAQLRELGTSVLDKPFRRKALQAAVYAALGRL